VQAAPLGVVWAARVAHKRLSTNNYVSRVRLEYTLTQLAKAGCQADSWSEQPGARLDSLRR
jgi:hypothetical protein